MADLLTLDELLTTTRSVRKRLDFLKADRHVNHVLLGHLRQVCNSLEGDIDVEDDPRLVGVRNPGLERGT